MSKIIARMTVTRQDQTRVIVEVPADATFHTFYRFYSQTGSKRSTKKLIRTASRNEGLHPVNAHLQIPGLNAVALRFIHNRFGNSPVISTQIRILSKRTYSKLINEQPDVLGQVRVRALFNDRPVKALRPVGPVTYRLVEKINHKKIHAGAR